MYVGEQENGPRWLRVGTRLPIWIWKRGHRQKRLNKITNDRTSLLSGRNWSHELVQKRRAFTGAV